MKKLNKLFIFIILLSILTACSKRSFDINHSINTISREDGSGTRSAFIELFNIEFKNGDNRKDMTTKDSIITNKTDVMFTNIENDNHAIGYASLGSLNNKIKSIKIDGVMPTEDNIKNGTYNIFRSFNIVTKGDTKGITKDFIDFILSSQGQKLIDESYISIYDNAPMYEPKNIKGKIVVGGSSSVSPIMEKLKEYYEKINPNSKVEIQITDSTSGITSAIEGTCDIGMSSRTLKENELLQLRSIEIALDGIAVIVNNQNYIDNLSNEMVKKIFTGEISNWNEVIN